MTTRDAIDSRNSLIRQTRRFVNPRSDALAVEVRQASPEVQAIDRLTCFASWGLSEDRMGA